MARVVVITGGGTGIGAACARLMRAAGDRVFITGRREAPLQAVANETGATALVGDAADGEVWRQRLLPAILDQTGGIDVLICSAGGRGEKMKAKGKCRVAAVLRGARGAFVRMVVFNELAHQKEKNHNKVFYRLCGHGEPQSPQRVFAPRLWLTHLSLNRSA